MQEANPSWSAGVGAVPPVVGLVQLALALPTHIAHSTLLRPCPPLPSSGWVVPAAAMPDWRSVRLYEPAPLFTRRRGGAMPSDDQQSTAVNTSQESGARKHRFGAQVLPVLSWVFVRLGEGLTAGLRGAGIGGRHGLVMGRMLGTGLGQAVDMLASLMISIADAAIPGPKISRLFPPGLFRLVYGTIGATCGLALGSCVGLVWGFATGLFGAAPLDVIPTGDPAGRRGPMGLGPDPIRSGPGLSAGPMGRGPSRVQPGPPMGPEPMRPEAPKPGSMPPGAESLGPGARRVGPRSGGKRRPAFGVAPGRQDATFGPVTGGHRPGELGDWTDRPTSRRPGG